MKQLIHKTSKTIKKSLLILFFATMALTGFAQVAINADGSSPDASAMLDVKSSNKGLLIPRLTEAERNAISSPATGLMIFQTNNTTGFYYYDGSNWEVIGSGAFSIDDLLDGKAGGNSVFLGDSAGTNDDGTDNYNTAVGYNALQTNTGARYNVAFGGSALKYSTGGSNTACGTGSSIYNTTGSFNTSVGRNALFCNTTGEGNTGIGSNANYYNEEGSYNTIVGYDAGMGTAKHNKSGNIFLGYQAGYNETGDNKLYIENSNSATPLIYGDFNSDILVVNGKLGVGVISPTSKLHIDATSGENGIRVQIGGITKLKVASNGSVVVGYNATSPTFALQLQNSAIDLQGRGIAYSWTTYSDGRLKTEQKELEYGLNEVMQLQPKSYFHHSSETSEDGTFTMLSSQKTFTFGFIAQELNQIIPEAVYVPEDETKNLWAIDYEKLIPEIGRASCRERV